MSGEIIMAVETSCDETAVAILAGGKDLLANIVASQVNVHRQFGGVVPEIASRKHLEQINYLIELALKEARLKFTDLTALAVTYGPGLVGALLVGVNTVKALAYSLQLPLLAINHLEGHLYANWLVQQNIEFPVIGLLVSGGHSVLIEMKDHGVYRLWGQTKDDAVGEAYDKIARAMGLGYPGGPLLDALANKGKPQYDLPRAWLGTSYDFSFSGLKTAVLNLLNRAKLKGEQIKMADLAASFQVSVVEVLVEKTVSLAQEKGIKTVLMAGGVSANSLLRKQMVARCQREGLKLYYPPLELCTDNAAMIAGNAYIGYRMGNFAPLNVNAYPGLLSL